MAKQTVQYKRTMKGSVGAGMGALFNASGRQFYILEHKSSSKYNRVGTSQKIIVDQIELGRNSNCQVRYDDELWPTVSRRHAAIERDEQGWKIIPLSQTNSTFVNGVKVETAWYLQNGDEIQLAANGPKLGFIQPSGKQSLVSSIRLTERLNLFRAQALKPYKTAIGVMATLLVVLTIGGSFWLHTLNKELINVAGKNVELVKMIAKADSCQKVKNTEDSIYQIKAREDYEKEKDERIRIQNELRNIKSLSSKIEKAKEGVYAVSTTVTVFYRNRIMYQSGSQGTGFLLDDGRFVTARHCVEPWMYDVGKLAHWVALSKTNNEMRTEVSIEAESMHDKISLPYSQFVVDRSHDISGIASGMEIEEDVVVPLFLESACPLPLKDGRVLGSEIMWGADWAYAKTSKKGSLKADIDLSKSLKAGTDVHVLGYPAGLGISDGQVKYEPIYNTMTISRNGLNNARCIMVSEGTAHGNSGGPVFVYKSGILYVIGIVSRLEGATQQVGTFGIVQQQQQYDHLVPMCNLK